MSNAFKITLSRNKQVISCVTTNENNAVDSLSVGSEVQVNGETWIVTKIELVAVIISGLIRKKKAAAEESNATV